MVTGGSGFVGSHCILQLLAAGHEVRTTVRKPEKEAAVRALLRQGGLDEADRLSFAVADLEADAGWEEALAGCQFVLHVASPFPERLPKDEDELIRPAREGTLRVLRAARDARVQRVVVTSSFAAIGYGQGPRPTPYDEECWTNPDGEGVMPYVRSKTLAERVAWDFVRNQAPDLELSVVNPVGIFGPALGKSLSTSLLLVQRLMRGALPGCPQFRFGVVDVRDVADLHLRAMTHDSAAGERFLAVAGDFLSVRQIAEALRRRLGDAARRVPARELPNWMVRMAALYDPAVKQILPELGRPKNATSAKARRVLGWAPRSSEDALVASAESMQRLGLLEPR